MHNLSPLSQRKLYFLLTVLLMAVTLRPLSADQAPPYGTYAASPSHPSTWVTGAMCTRKQLRWDGDHGLLVADVTYSNQDYADATNPTRQDDFILSFPGVRLNQNHEFVADGRVIGSLKDVFLGHEVVLKPGVVLSVHRHHGIIHAALIHLDSSQ